MMLSRKRLLSTLAILAILSLMLTACELPSRSGGDDLQTVPDAPASNTEGGEAAVVDPNTAPAEEAAVEAVVEEQPAEEAPAEAVVEEQPAEEAAAEAVVEEQPAEEAAAEEQPAEEAAAEESPRADEEAAAEEQPAEEAAAEEQPAEEAAAEEQPAEEATAEEQPAEAKDGVHVVAAGENLYRIGLQYGVSWVALASENNLSNANSIVVGQELKIPSSEPVAADEQNPTPVPTDETTYTVQAGDNLYRIGLAFGLSWVQVAEANGLVNPNSLTVGQVLKIPSDEPGPSPEFIHEVQPGDTLLQIALRYGVTWTSIAEANELETPYVIYANQSLVIPGKQ